MQHKLKLKDNINRGAKMLNDLMFDLIYITDTIITVIMKLSIIILIYKIIIGLRKKCNLLNKGQLK